MNHKRFLARMIVGFLLSGAIALTGFNLPSAHAGPVSPGTIAAFNPQPEPPGRPVTASNPGLESPSVRVGFDPQPEPPLRKTIAVSP